MSTASADLWSTVPENDEQRWEVLQRLRAIDSCALLPPAALGEHGSVREIGSHSTLPTSCRAVVDTGSATPLTVDWDVQKGVMQGVPVPEVRRVGDIRITEQRDEAGGDPAEPRDCRLTAHFPSEVLLFLDTEAAPPTDGCAVAHRLLDTAIALLATEPPHGTSPDSATTVLTGADPCAALSPLGITPAAPAEQHIQMCVAGKDADEIVISYNYDGERTVVESDATTTIGARTVYTSKFQEFYIYEFVAGSPIAPGDELFGPIVPSVSVTGRDESLVDKVTRQLFITLG
ncbi:hypothetical protein [Nocardia sp. CA-290969]|uniref:hypothetical protein n=1 Tax=Nocardia sp. CA-290969 TaxID=3239986 RepID=UPI003D93DCAA